MVGSNRRVNLAQITQYYTILGLLKTLFPQNTELDKSSYLLSYSTTTPGPFHNRFRLLLDRTCWFACKLLNTDGDLLSVGLTISALCLEFLIWAFWRYSGMSAERLLYQTSKYVLFFLCLFTWFLPSLLTIECSEIMCTGHV